MSLFNRREESARTKIKLEGKKKIAVSHNHRAPESICVRVSEKESVTNLTGTEILWSISKGDVGVGGEMVRTIKSYRIAFI